MSFLGIEDLLELLMEVDEVLEDSSEWWERGVHIVQLPVHLLPLKVVQPVGWVCHLFNLTLWASQEEAPLKGVNLVVTKQNLGTQKK